MFPFQRDNNPKASYTKVDQIQETESVQIFHTSIQLRISGKIWKLMFICILDLVWQSLSSFAKKNGHKYRDPEVDKDIS